MQGASHVGTGLGRVLAGPAGQVGDGLAVPALGVVERTDGARQSPHRAWRHAPDGY